MPMAWTIAHDFFIMPIPILFLKRSIGREKRHMMQGHVSAGSPWRCNLKSTLNSHLEDHVSFRLGCLLVTVGLLGICLMAETPLSKAKTPDPESDHSMNAAICASLIKDLRHQEPGTRRLALQILALVGTGKETPQVLPLLFDPSDNVKKAAISFFAAHPSPAPLAELWRRWRDLMREPSPGDGTALPDEIKTGITDALMDYLSASSAEKWFESCRTPFVQDLQAIRQGKLYSEELKQEGSEVFPARRKALVLLVRMGEVSLAESNLPPEIVYGQAGKHPPAGRGGMDYPSAREALAVLHHPPAGGGTWWEALSWLQLHPTPEALAGLVEWLEQNMAALPAETSSSESQATRSRWAAVVDCLRQVGVPSQAEALASAWDRCLQRKAAYDLAWLAVRMGGPRAVIQGLKSAEPWRQEQIALLLYGCRDQLDAEATGQVLAVKKLCRYQSLWLLESLLAQSADRNPTEVRSEVVALLRRHEVPITPELLFALREADPAWVKEQARQILSSDEDVDAALLCGLLPDFHIPEAAEWAKKELNKSDQRQAAAMRALSRLDSPFLQVWMKENAYRSSWESLRAGGRTLTDNLLADPQSPALRHLLLSNNGNSDRLKAMEAWFDELTESVDGRAVPLAMEAVRQGGSAAVRAQAVRYLGQVGTPAVADVVRLAVADPDTQVQKSAIIALGKVGQPFDLPRLKECMYRPATALTAVVAINMLEKGFEKKRSVCEEERLLPWAVTESADTENALPSLHIPKAAFLPLASALLSRRFGPNEPELLTLLCQQDRARLLRIAQSALAFGTDRERAKAAGWLGLLRDAGNVDPLLAALDDPDEDVRQVAAVALACQRDERILPLLRKKLNDPQISPALRDMLVESILTIDPALLLAGDAQPLLTDERVLLAVLYDAGRKTDESVADRKIRLWKLRFSFDEDEWIQKALVDGVLLRLGDSQAKVQLLALQEENFSDTSREEILLRSALAQFPFGNLPDGGTDHFRERLTRSSCREERIIAAIRLALLGDPAASGYLVEQLGNDNRRDEWGRFLAAFEALTVGTTPRPGVAETLINIVNQGEVQKDWNWLSGAAVMALGNLGDRRALPALCRARLSNDALLSFYAATAMDRLADEAFTLSLLQSEQIPLLTAGIHLSRRFPGEDVSMALRHLLTHADWRVRGFALHVLGSRPLTDSGQTSWTSTLANLAERDPSGRVRAEARAQLAVKQSPAATTGESYFAASLLQEGIGCEETGLDFFFPLVELNVRCRMAPPGSPETLARQLRKIVRGETSPFSREMDMGSAQYVLLQEMLPQLFALHLLVEIQVPDAYDLFRDWLQAHPAQGTWFDEVVSGAAGILGTALRDPRVLPLLQARRTLAREWLTQGLLSIGERQLTKNCPIH